MVEAAGGEWSAVAVAQEGGGGEDGAAGGDVVDQAVGQRWGDRLPPQCAAFLAELDQASVGFEVFEAGRGLRRGIGGRYRIGHSVMADALDQDGIWNAIKDAGLDLPDRPHHSDLHGRLVNVFLKCEVSQEGTVRGRRNAMLDDSDVHWHRQIKSRVGGVTAAVTGDPAVFVSVSAAHQGPDGGGPVAAIVDLG